MSSHGCSTETSQLQCTFIKITQCVGEKPRGKWGKLDGNLPVACLHVFLAASAMPLAAFTTRETLRCNCTNQFSNFSSASKLIRLEILCQFEVLLMRKNIGFRFCIRGTSKGRFSFCNILKVNINKTAGEHFCN